MFSKEEFDSLPAGVRARIDEDSISCANNRANAMPITTHHSFDQLVVQNRHIAIAARMTSRPLQWYEKSYNPVTKQIINMPRVKAYTGQDIADIFIDSAKKNGFCYYPMTGDWTETGVKQLVCFVKNGGAYIPYVRFTIDTIEVNSALDDKHLRTLTDITPAVECKHRSVLKISTPQKENLPQYFLGLRSCDELQNVAFKGSAANIMMI